VRAAWSRKEFDRDGNECRARRDGSAGERRGISRILSLLASGDYLLRNPAVVAATRRYLYVITASHPSEATDALECAMTPRRHDETTTIYIASVEVSVHEQS